MTADSSKPENEYPNAPARPHTGDRVHVNADTTVRLSEDVTGIVKGTKRDGPVGGGPYTQYYVRVSHGPRAAVHPFPIEGVTLLEATTTRFDNFDPADHTEIDAR